MNANPQMDLFAAPEEKSYPGANGVKLPYWEQDGKIIRIALSDKLILPVTNQKGGHIYTFVPGYGRLEKRGKNAKTSFLSHAAALRRSLELNESIARNGQSIVRDAEEQGDLLRAAEAKSLEQEAEIARLLAELESLRNQKQESRRWVNNRAVEWALDQKLPPGMKVILITFAAHSDEHGESWPSVEHIAKKSKMDRATVRAAIRSLNADKLLIDTGRRAGDTHQVKVQRLPESVVKAVAVTTPSIEDESGDKAAIKRRESGDKAVSVTTANKEEGIRNKNKSEKKASGTSLPSLGDGPLAGGLSSFFSSLSSQKEQGQEPAWFDEIRGMYPGTTVTGDLKRLEEWARKKKKPFTRDLALNALRRHPPKKPGQREGYVYKGKFIGNEKANALAVQNPELLLNAKRAIRHADGQIEMIEKR
jgi:Helix-turn-helix domain